MRVPSNVPEIMFILRDDYALARAGCKEAKVKPPVNHLRAKRETI
jgi:hypothetical protein